MAKIFCLLGKSSTGKDTIYKKILESGRIDLKTITMYTTRPMREGERDGVEYFFVDNDRTEGYEQDGSIIEMRIYNTVHGPWKYYTRNDGQIELKGNDKYLIIGTLEVYEHYCRYFGKEYIVPIYIEIDDGERLQRALDRERKQAVPKYAELCRRFLADDKDFSQEKLKACGIEKRFVNEDLECCTNEIIDFIKYND